MEEEEDRKEAANIDKSIVKCFNCHKLGHFQWECPSKEKGENFAKTQEEMLLMACMDMNKDNKEDMWYLDLVVAIICVENGNIFIS